VSKFFNNEVQFAIKFCNAIFDDASCH
jgi:hypothetical protein